MDTFIPLEQTPLKNSGDGLEMSDGKNITRMNYIIADICMKQLQLILSRQENGVYLMWH